MFSDERIMQLIESGVLNNADRSCVGPISYDLNTKSFYDAEGERQAVTLSPGDSTFVSCIETINLPGDISASIHLKNSRIRQGLTLDAPVYFPGHHTRVFFRVTNVSASSITLSPSRKIAQIMFEKVDGEVLSPYDGAFSDELDFSGMSGYSDVYRSEMEEIDRKADELKDMEKRIYERTIALLAIFAAVFTLVNVNAGMAGAGAGTVSIAAIDLSIVGGFSALVGLIGFVLDVKSMCAKVAPIVLAIIAFLAASFI